MEHELLGREFAAGRQFLGRLPHGRDIIAAIEDFCIQQEILAGSFSLIGAVSAATMGAYDQQKQEYMSFKKEGNLEILSCLGNISLKDGQPFVHGHIALADESGQTTGGHLFSETTIFAGEIHLIELTGTPHCQSLERIQDEITGLMLWDMNKADIKSS